MANLELQVISHMLDKGNIKEFLDLGLQQEDFLTGAAGGYFRTMLGYYSSGSVVGWNLVTGQDPNGQVLFPNLVRSAYDPGVTPRQLFEMLRKFRVEKMLEGACTKACDGNWGPEARWRVQTALDEIRQLETASSAPDIVNLMTLMNENQRFETWLVEELQLAVGSPTIITGLESTGKTTLLQHVAICMSAGLSLFTGQRVARGGYSVHLPYEKPDQIVQRYRQLMIAMGINHPLYISVVKDLPGNAKMKLCNKNYDELVKRFRGHAFGFVDCFASAIQGVFDPDKEEAAEGIEVLTRVSMATGCAIAVVGHSGKKKEEGAEYRGSGAIKQRCGSGFTLTKHKSGIITVRNSRQHANHPQRPDFHFFMRSTPGDGLRLELCDRPRREQSTDLSTRVGLVLSDLEKKILQHRASHPGVSKNKLYEAIGGDRTAFFKAVKQLERKLGEEPSGDVH